MARPCWSRSSSWSASIIAIWVAAIRRSSSRSATLARVFIVREVTAEPSSAAERADGTDCHEPVPSIAWTRSRSPRRRSRSPAPVYPVGSARATSSSASRTGARSSVNSCSCSRPRSMRKTPTWRPATAGSLSHASAAVVAFVRASGPRRSKTRATTASASRASGLAGAPAGEGAPVTGAPAAAEPSAGAAGATAGAAVAKSWKRPTSWRTPSSKTSTSLGTRSRTMRPLLSLTTKSTDTSAAWTSMRGTSSVGAGGAWGWSGDGRTTAVTTASGSRRIERPRGGFSTSCYRNRARGYGAARPNGSRAAYDRRRRHA